MTLLIPLMLSSRVGIDMVEGDHLRIDGTTYRFDRFARGNGNEQIVLAVMIEEVTDEP